MIKRVDSVSECTEGKRTYAENVSLGNYERYKGGLTGKHDNVRKYWEDQVTRNFLRPFIKERVDFAKRMGRGLRVVDLGCGSGQGYELLTRIPQRDLGLDVSLRYVLPPAQMDRYLGIDISEDMVEQGRENYNGTPGVSFEVGDLREGLGRVRSEQPFDIYFSSYGSMSHLENASIRWCLRDVVRHAEAGALIVLDLVGKYSCEWPAYWNTEKGTSGMHEYSMSYLLEKQERINRDIEKFSLRFWSGSEVEDLCFELNDSSGLDIRVLKSMDRSLFVGRHVDTREYGCLLPPLRHIVNRLYEVDVRTGLNNLKTSYTPTDGFPEENRFLISFGNAWNQLVEFTLERLAGNPVDLVDLEGWPEFPPALQLALMNMDRVVDSVGWIKAGDVRANILEPQLAYSLRNLEQSFQCGHGFGHSLVAVLMVGSEIKSSGL